MRRTFFVIALALIACSRDNTPTAPLPSRIDVLRGDVQSGYVDTTLAVDFVVRVTDGNGRNIPNAAVEWRITAGNGELARSTNGMPFAITNENGLAAASFRPTSLGPLAVTAFTATASATFRATARRKPNALIRILQGFDCGDASTFVGPNGASDVTVHVGDVVEWDYSLPNPSIYTCTARVQSRVVPTSGSPFDGIMNTGETFQFVPDAPGIWIYVDVNNGGVGSLTAIPRP